MPTLRKYRCGTKRSLKRHTYTHTGEKQYVCGFCDKRFNQMNHLKGHFFTHAGEKPFKRSKCDYRTSEKISFAEAYACSYRRKTLQMSFM